MSDGGPGSMSVDRFRLPATRFDFTSPVPAVSSFDAAHFIAIGGSGMSGIAHLFLDAGCRVSGSDRELSPAVTRLQEAGAAVATGHDAAHLPGPGSDLLHTDGATDGSRIAVVVSSAIRDDNPELVAARERGLTVLHRSQGIAAVLGDGQREVIAVAGANGKTTTSAMVTVALHQAGAAPGFVVGAPIGGWNRSADLGDGRPFVVEADESDGSFLTYRPTTAVVTNIRPDHLDHYGSLEAIEEAFRAFASTIQPGGLLVVCSDDPGAAALGAWYEAEGGRVLRYGVGVEADVRITDVTTKADGSGVSATLLDGVGVADRDIDRHIETSTAASRDAATVQIRYPGLHNLSNAAAAYTAAVHGGSGSIDPDLVLAGLASFAGTARRFEEVGTAAGVRVIDDYAHNPDKVAAVVAAGRSVVDGVDEPSGESGDGAGTRRLIVIFEPHLFSRTRDFTEEFAQALSGADEVIVLDIYPAREDPIPGVTGATVSDAVTRLWSAKGGGGTRRQATFAATRQDAVEAGAALARPGDLVLTVGAGTITTLGPELLAQLNSGAE